MGKMGAFKVYVVLIFYHYNTFQIVQNAYFSLILITFGFSF